MNAKLPPSLKDTLPPYLQAQWQQLEQSHENNSVTSVRINPKKYTTQFDYETPITWCPFGRYLNERPKFTVDPLFHAGTYYVQEASSMFLEYALKQVINFQEAEQLRVLDLCAAPGGKSTHAASLLNENSLLISNEVIASRVNILNENICKWGYDNTWICNNDPSHFGRIPDFFDVMLVDAPCSGSGLFRKIPEYADSWNTDLVALCAQRQKRILHDAYSCLAKNGYLVYMTCSLSEEENEHILDFLMNEYELETCKINITELNGIIETESEKHKAYGYRFFPHLVQGEGFFLAVFKKKDGNEKEHFETKENKNKAPAQLDIFSIKKEIISFSEKENLFLMRPQHQELYTYLSKRIKLIKKGILAGKILPKEIIPSHEIAMYEGCGFSENIVNLNLQDAVLYLKKENINISLDKKGWYLARYENHNLGWIKNIGSRINNYYPANYRILSRNILPSQL